MGAWWTLRRCSRLPRLRRFTPPASHRSPPTTATASSLALRPRQALPTSSPSLASPCQRTSFVTRSQTAQSSSARGSRSSTPPPSSRCTLPAANRLSRAARLAIGWRSAFRWRALTTCSQRIRSSRARTCRGGVSPGLTSFCSPRKRPGSIRPSASSWRTRRRGSWRRRPRRWRWWATWAAGTRRLTGTATSSRSTRFLSRTRTPSCSRTSSSQRERPHVWIRGASFPHSLK
mmetsp:Transcript_2932/g.4837  ORF Transcript_2932/g.4837 Transcript_2932/m.4837 type:complete len:232 (-) Transcript_2932:311-1006(-)